MGRHLALVVPFIAFVSELYLETPVIWMLIVERVTRVAGVGVQAECDQVKLIIFASHPGHLQKYISLSVSLHSSLLYNDYKSTNIRTVKIPTTLTTLISKHDFRRKLSQ